MNQLCQWMTPGWLAEALLERHFSGLGPDDLVVEPTCGDGAFLRALPAAVPGFGVEFDPRLAAVARESSGREVLEGDFLSLPLGLAPTAAVGNPPFRGSFVSGMLRRLAQLLPEGGRAGFILPARMLRSATRVFDDWRAWSIEQEMIPASAFAVRMREPILFAVFSRGAARRLVGFALYAEEADRQDWRRRYREAAAGGAAWRGVCRLALERLGGEADLPAIYGELEGNRPSRTEWWREKVRQTMRVYHRDFEPVGDAGRYRLREGA